MNLEQIFENVCSRFSKNKVLHKTLWMEIELAYTGRDRHYHNMEHLQSLYQELEACKAEVAGENAVMFSLFYHDIVYKSTSKSNEEKSAELASKRLQTLSLPAPLINQVYQYILATKGHEVSDSHDCNLFTDADLSILGRPWDEYVNYLEQVRAEYSIYPNFLYRPGRKKVLHHFLDMPRIYKTDFFFSRYEIQARENLQKELMAF